MCLLNITDCFLALIPGYLFGCGTIWHVPVPYVDYGKLFDMLGMGMMEFPPAGQLPRRALIVGVFPSLFLLVVPVVKAMYLLLPEA